MAKRGEGAAHPWQALEEEAYHAFREWPIWLVLRERELGRRLDGAAAPANPGAPGDAPASVTKRTHAARVDGGRGTR